MCKEFVCELNMCISSLYDHTLTVCESDTLDFLTVTVLAAYMKINKEKNARLMPDKLAVLTCKLLGIKVYM